MFKLTKGSKGYALHYFSGGDRQGYWRGAGAKTLGVSGSVKETELEQILSGIEPRTGNFLLGKPKREPMVYLDTLLAAPKSVSVLAIAMEQTAILEAHRQAVDKAIEQLETIAEAELYCQGQRILQRTNNLAIACFEHWEARLDANATSIDPHLHTHLAIANLTMRSDGRWRALRNRPFYKQQMEIGLAYQYQLATLLNEAGYRLKFSDNGTFDIDIGRDVVEYFSNRSRSIEKEKEKAKEAKYSLFEAKRKTRKPKKEYDLAETVEDWIRKAQQLRMLNYWGVSQAQQVFLGRMAIAKEEGFKLSDWQLAYQEASQSSKLSTLASIRRADSSIEI